MAHPTTRSLEMFDAVAETGSFRAAADRLGLSPSAVSKAMTELEARLGARLIARTTRQLALTEAGQAYHASVVAALSALEEGAETVNAVTAAPRGLLRLAMPVTFGHMYISPLLPRFAARYPDVRLDVTSSDGYVDVVGGGYDVVIRGAVSLPDSSLTGRKIMETPTIVCASPDYLARHGTPEDPTGLADHNCLVATAAQTIAEWVFDIDGAATSVRVSGQLRGTSLIVARDAAVAGLGIVRVPLHFAAPDLEAGRLVRILSDFEYEEAAVFVLYPAQRELALKTRAFVDFLAEEVGSVRN
ncbi:MAG: LysR family transcriptional regulator [Alphaproteobacteria bacterium]|nr:LysR family transcriptional regulator [Alphaproteobacteria bacterium]